MVLEQLENAAVPLKISLWRIDEEEAYFHARVPEAEAYPARHPVKRLQGLAARWALRDLLNLPPSVGILNGNRGKPYLSDGSQHISLSHTMGYAAVMASPTAAVAVDVENLSLTRDLAVHQLFLNPAEVSSFLLEPTLQRFLLFWSAKETLYKLFRQHTQELSFQHNLAVQLPIALNANGMLSCEITTPEVAMRLQVHYRQGYDYLYTYAHSFFSW